MLLTDEGSLAPARLENHACTPQCSPPPQPRILETNVRPQRRLKRPHPPKLALLHDPRDPHSQRKESTPTTACRTGLSSRLFTPKGRHVTKTLTARKRSTLAARPTLSQWLWLTQEIFRPMQNAGGDPDGPGLSGGGSSAPTAAAAESTPVPSIWKGIGSTVSTHLVTRTPVLS